MLQNSDVKKTSKRAQLKYQITSQENLTGIFEDQDNQKLVGKTQAQKAAYYGINKKTYDSIIKRGTYERKGPYYTIETNLYTRLEQEYISESLQIEMIQERVKELLETEEFLVLVKLTDEINKVKRDQGKKKKTSTNPELAHIQQKKKILGHQEFLQSFRERCRGRSNLKYSKEMKKLKLLLILIKAKHYGIDKKTYDSIVKRQTQWRKRKYQRIETDLYTSLEKDYIGFLIEIETGDSLQNDQSPQIRKIYQRIEKLLETNELKHSIKVHDKENKKNSSITPEQDHIQRKSIRKEGFQGSKNWYKDFVMKVIVVKLHQIKRNVQTIALKPDTDVGSTSFDIGIYFNDDKMNCNTFQNEDQIDSTDQWNSFNLSGESTRQSSQTNQFYS